MSRTDEFLADVARKVDALPSLQKLSTSDQMVNRFLILNQQLKDMAFGKQQIYGDQWKELGQKFLSLFAWFSLRGNRERTYSRGIDAELKIKKAEYMQSLKTADSKVTENRAEAEIEYADITWESIKADHQFDLYDRMAEVCRTYVMFAQSAMSWERSERMGTTTQEG